MLRAVFFVVTLAFAVPAFSQGVYVSGFAGSESLLVSHTEIETVPAGVERGGTAATFGGRVGMPLGDRWGVELEGAQSLTLENTNALDSPIFAGQRITFGSATGPLLPVTLAAPRVTIDAEQRLTTVNVAGWYRYTMSARVDLAFLAGATFWRRSSEQRFTVGPIQLPPGFPPGILPIPQFPTTSAVAYGVGPLFGAETWLSFGDRVRVVPGVRLSAVGAAWSIRPTAALAWMF
jgi:hypothetical protein